MISSEGTPYIVTVGALAAGAHYFVGPEAAVPFYAALVLGFYAFRDPDREIPSLPLAVLSPIDGTVERIEEVRDEYLKRDAIAITIRMKNTGPYVTRSPVEGKVVQRWYSATGHVGNGDDRAQAGGQGGIPRYGIWVQTDEGDDVVLVMESAARFNRPRCYVQFGERIGHGQRCGFVPFGSRLIVLVSANSRVEVKVGDHVRAGLDPIATLVH